MDNTEKIKKRYNRIAPIFDYMESMMQAMIPKEYIQKAFGSLYGSVLEVGVGTGKNLPYYPSNCTVTGIDFSPRMLEIAKNNIYKAKAPVTLLEMDAEHMDFPDNTFDCIINTFVFCSVPDPLQGLKEIKRVCKPGGTIVMIEHVRSNNLILGKIMDVLNPLVVNIIGANINRNTIENIERSGIKINKINDCCGKILNLVIAEG